MNFDNNPILYPKDDEPKPTKDDGLNPPCYPKEDGLNPFKAIVERINALESAERNNKDSFETKELTVSENAQIKKLNATEGTVDTLNSTNCNIKNAEIENLRTKRLTWDLPSIDVENAQVGNLNATEGTVTNLNSTTSTVTNLNATTSTVTNLNATTSNVTNANVENAQVGNLNITTEIKVGNLKTEEPILSNSAVGYDENGKIIPIKIADYNDLMNLIYPVGSLYWSSKSTNPATLFGGTWVQIKDRFVLACGDTYTSVGATGGSEKITVDNLPSHNHNFSGTTATTTNTVTDVSGSTTTKNLTGRFSGGKTDSEGRGAYDYNKSNGMINLDGKAETYQGDIGPMSLFSINANHQHRFTPSGTIGYTGSGTDYMPPYVVKYCWERTA